MFYYAYCLFTTITCSSIKQNYCGFFRICHNIQKFLRVDIFKFLMYLLMNFWLLTYQMFFQLKLFMLLKKCKKIFIINFFVKFKFKHNSVLPNYEYLGFLILRIITLKASIVLLKLVFQLTNKNRIIIIHSSYYFSY